MANVAKDGGLSPLGDWKVNNLRLTHFPADTFEVRQCDWWESIVGKQPEKRESRPSVQRHTDVGEFEAGRLVNSISRARIDWHYVALEREPQPAPFSELGGLPDVLPMFVQLMKKWFKEAPGARRVALGGAMHAPVDSRKDGNVKLGEYVPSLKFDDPENTTDLMYRVNRRRPSEVLEGTMLNRLCTWSVVESVLTEISAQPGGDLPIDARQVGEKAFVCRLELDINRDQFFQGIIERDLLAEVLDELADTAKQFVREGDVP